MRRTGSSEDEEAGRGRDWKVSAARRMKGVVRPQARPTRRKARVWRRGEELVEEGGEGEEAVEEREGVDMVVRWWG